MAILRFGSPEYFQALDQQVNAMLAPQLAAGIMKQDQANEYRAEAQRKAQAQVDKHYGRTSKYDAEGRQIFVTANSGDLHTGRVSLPQQVITNPLARLACVDTRQQRNGTQKRRQHLKAARNKNRELVASKKGFAPRRDGGFGDGPKQGRKAA
ncbi:hypothetical protein [Marinobacter salarius]|uniref:hypothetical protein n=1 Tax=Marinobacter salarius TaxID=1420917 RepID=UPI003D14840F